MAGLESEWHSENEQPTDRGWYLCDSIDGRWNGEFRYRAWGNGYWWIPLPDGWISAPISLYRWKGPPHDIMKPSPHGHDPQPNEKAFMVNEKKKQKIERERDRLGRLVGKLWISWAETQPNPKPSWLVPYDQLSEVDKEADRVIGYGLMTEFYAETTGERLEHERLKQIAFRLRQELHGFRQLFDENDPSSGKAIQQFDEFVGEVYLVNAAAGITGDLEGEHQDGCIRCSGCGVIPTEGNESVYMGQEKACPDCRGIGQAKKHTIDDMD
jgi:phage FluMu protein Com